MSAASAISRTGLETADCPFRYFMKFIRNVSDSSDEALRGQVFHTAAAYYIEDLVKAGLRSDFELASAALDRALIDDRCPSHLMDEVENLWQRWIERFELNLDAYLLHEENQTDGEYSWRPDLVYAHEAVLEILDWKTYWVGFSEAQARQDFQARFYSWQASKIWPGFETYRFTFDFVRLNHTATVDFTAQELDVVERQVTLIAESIHEAQRYYESLLADGVDEATAIRKAWKARPGHLCSFCRLVCPAEQSETLPIRIVSREDAERIYGETLAAEAAIAAKKKLLKAWVATEGAVRVNGCEYAEREKAFTTYPAVDVLAILGEKGIVPTDLTFGSTALKPYLKKNPELSELATVKRTWEARTKKVKGKDSGDISQPAEELEATA